MIVKSKVKYINSLGDKKQRDADRVFVAEGPKIINELLDERSVFPVELFALKEWLEANETSGIAVHEIDEVLLGRLSFLSTPNNVVGIFRMPELPPLNLTGRVSLVLDGIQDPGNLGTIIRCADWFGVDQIICSRDCADVFNPKTVQSTMGSIGRINVYYEDLYELIRTSPVKSYATALSGTSVHEVGKVEEGLVIVGNESRGIRDNIMELATEKITIPKLGRAESLNAAVATGIILSFICPSASRSRS